MWSVVLWIVGPIAALYAGFSLYQKYNWLRFENGDIVPTVSILGTKIDPPKYFQQTVDWHKQKGPIYQMWFLNRPMLVISDPVAIRKSMAEPAMHNRLSFWPMEEAFNSKGIIFATNIEYHRLHRGLALNGLMKSNVLRHTTHVIHEKMAPFFDEIEKKLDSDGTTELEITSRLHGVTSDIIAKSAFGLDFDAYNGKSSALQNAFQVMLLKPMEFMTYPKFMKRFIGKAYAEWQEQTKIAKEATVKIVADRRKSKAQVETDRHDFLEELINAKDPKTGEPLPDEDLFIDAGDILFAGHETTAYALNFACHLLSMSPDWQLRLQKECDEFPAQPSYEDTHKMQISQAIIKETLRMFPLATSSSRQLSADLKIQGILVPKGTIVQTNFYWCMNSPDNYKNPDQFNPARWLETINSEEKSERPEDIAWMPFGTGTRSCAGMRLALLELKLILHRIFSKYSVKPVSETQIHLPIVSLPTLKPEKPLVVKFIRRKSPNIN